MEILLVTLILVAIFLLIFIVAGMRDAPNKFNIVIDIILIVSVIFFIIKPVGEILLYLEKL